jgi:hypothetical protein
LLSILTCAVLLALALVRPRRTWHSAPCRCLAFAALAAALGQLGVGLWPTEAFFVYCDTFPWALYPYLHYHYAPDLAGAGFFGVALLVAGNVALFTRKEEN